MPPRIASAMAEFIGRYAHLVVKNLPAQLAANPDVASIPLPSGLRGIYAEFMRRELCAPGKEELWIQTYRPVLGLIAVSAAL